MADDLDIKIAQALFFARLLERALHDPGPWTVSLCDQIAPAEIEVFTDGIRFLAPIDLKPGRWLMSLCCRDEEISNRIMDVSTTQPTTVEWVFNVSVPSMA